MDSFPVQKKLIDSVIAFASADIAGTDDVRAFFTSEWQPDSIPGLRSCRIIQGETRQWLLHGGLAPKKAVSGGASLDKWSRGGVILDHTELDLLIDDGIRLEGRVAVKPVPVLGGHEDRVVWDWHVTSASLRAICGLAAATAMQEGMPIRQCARQAHGTDKACKNLFIDRRSRGKPQKYCKARECDLIYNRMTTAESRGGKK